MYKGNQILAEMLLDEKIDPKHIDEDISYNVEKLTENITKITFRGMDPMKCPCYCLFDGRYMMWYGDYGSFTFDCTWNPNLSNLPYNSPYYMWEKYDGPSRHKVKEWSSELCRKELLENVKSTYTFEYDLTEKQRKDFISFLENGYWYLLDNYKSLRKYEDEVKAVKKVYDAANEDQIEYISAVRDFNDDSNSLLDNTDCEIYSYGEKLPLRFLMIFYKLSCINNIERNKEEEEK